MGQPKIKKDIEARIMDIGDTMTGNFHISPSLDAIPNFFMDASNGQGGFLHIYKNASSSKDYGTNFVDHGMNGQILRLILSGNENKAQLKIQSNESDQGQLYTLLHSGNIESYALPISGGTLTGQLKANKNISIVNTNPWVLLNDTDTGYDFYVQVSGSLLGLGRGWENSLLINTAGQVTLQTKTSIADNTPAGIFFHITQTDNNITTKSAYIKVYDDHDAQAYGTTMVIHSAGNMIIGAGEAPNACYTTDLVNSTTENMYIVSDNNIYFYTNCNTYANKKTSVYINTSGVLYGAAWNDYAEYRIYSDEEIPYGKCVVEVGDDTMRLAEKRLEPGTAICSDTFGFAIGETEESQMPIAVSGRVLAYPFEGREVFAKNIGKPVCSGPNGTVSLMTDEEYQKYGYCCIGTISAIPEYETWGTGNIKVNNRVWIQVK